MNYSGLKRNSVGFLPKWEQKKAELDDKLISTSKNVVLQAVHVKCVILKTGHLKDALRLVATWLQTVKI